MAAARPPGFPRPREPRPVAPAMGSPGSPPSFARSVQAQPEPFERLRRGVELAVELVEGCDHAGVTLASRVAVESAAATDDVVRRGDALQYELSEGPCLDAVRRQHTVISPDLAVDVRWTSWAPRVHAELGVRAMLSLLLFTERDSLGALNLYADRVDAWTGGSVAVALSLADQLAVALADAREIEHRGRAMVGRTIIGQAQGIVMERFDLDAEQAFAYLRRISQSEHVKLLVVAEDLVRTRRIPAVDL